MRLVRFRDQAGQPRQGVVDGDQITVIQGSIFGSWQRMAERTALAGATLLAPVEPVNLLCIGRNYREHAAEGKNEVPSAPLLFIKATSAVIGPGETIRLPRIAPDNVDFEAELAVVIGRPARRVSPEAALDYVLGYTCANDVSARDVQRGDAQWARGKSFDTFAPLGPWIETEFDPRAARVQGRLNGRTMQDGNTAQMMFPVAELISYLSQGMTLLPGTVLLTGTPAGVGFARQPPVWLRPGDRYDVEIDGIGTLSNPVAAE